MRIVIRGFGLEVKSADVGAPLAAIEVNLGGFLVDLGDGFLPGGGLRDDGENAATVGEKAIAVTAGSCVVNANSRDCVEAVDRISGADAVWISGGS